MVDIPTLGLSRRHLTSRDEDILAKLSDPDADSDGGLVYPQVVSCYDSGIGYYVWLVPGGDKWVAAMRSLKFSETFISVCEICAGRGYELLLFANLKGCTFDRSLPEAGREQGSVIVCDGRIEEWAG